jgi:hypothetical protein
VKAQQKKKLLKDIKRIKEKRIAKKIEFALVVEQNFQSITITYCVTRAT